MLWSINQTSKAVYEAAEAHKHLHQIYIPLFTKPELGLSSLQRKWEFLEEANKTVLV